jgi:membrane protein required for colicin V production
VNIVDAVLAAVLCVFAVRGYVKGLFREVFALLGLSVGFIVSVRYYEQVSLWVDSWPYSPLILQGIVFVTLFFLVYIALNWVGLMLHRSAGFLFLGGFNRLGGLLVGGSKGALFLGVGLFFAISQSWVPPNFQQQFGKAALVGPLFGFGAWAASKGAAVTWPGASGTDSTASDSRRDA